MSLQPTTRSRYAENELRRSPSPPPQRRSPIQIASIVSFFTVAAAWVLWRTSARLGNDSEDYFVAARAIALGHDPYDPGNQYIYPPFLASVLRLIPSTWQSPLWNVVVSTSAVVLLYATLVLARLHRSKVVAFGVVLLLGHSFESGVGMANAQLPVAALLAVALCLTEKRRHGAAGILIGLAAGIKVTPALMIVFLLLRAAFARDKRLARAAALSILVGASTLLSSWTWRWFELVRSGLFSRERILSGANISWCAFVAQAGGRLPVFVPVLLAMAMTFVTAKRQACRLAPALAVVTALALAGSPVAWGYAYLTLLPAVAVLLRAVREGRHFLGITPGRALVEYGLIVVFSVIAVNADHFYLREQWAGRHLGPLFPLIGTCLLAYAIVRSECLAGASVEPRADSALEANAELKTD